MIRLVALRESRFPHFINKGYSMPGTRRPRRSNSALSIVRGIKTLKTIYWTTSRLRKLLPGVFSAAREEHFAKALKVLREWPEKNSEQILDAASRVNVRRGVKGRWLWLDPLRALQTYADRAPPDGIDPDKLRETQAGMDSRTRERFMELLTEGLEDDPNDQPPGLHISTLRKVKRGHIGWQAIARRLDCPDSQPPFVPRPLTSDTGRIASDENLAH
jgi:hypothetical protein